MWRAAITGALNRLLVASGGPECRGNRDQIEEGGNPADDHTQTVFPPSGLVIASFPLSHPLFMSQWNKSGRQ